MINHMYTWIERIWRFQATVEAVSDVAAAAATSLDPRQSTINQQHQGQGPSAAGAGAGVLVSGHHDFLVSK